MADVKAEASQDEARFKNDMFLHAFGSPTSYEKLFPEDMGMSIEDQQSLDFKIPESPEELEALFAELDALDGIEDTETQWRNRPIL